MTADVAIEIENLGKQYRIGELQTYRTFRESLQGWATAPFRRLANGHNKTVNGNGKANHDDTIWALKDVSFSVKQGEVLGIIGHNGAGKSTLLKILSRITEPTTGEVRIHGRVNSLLEVGTGFHPELTGRENIFLNGSILGMSRAEIKRKFDEIVEFSGVEKFLDTPVKRYSSGMRVRLAFAVAAHLEPEILIIDEVLAVGDAAFQKKCLGKMKDVSNTGRTVLFVSHHMAAVRQLCDRGIIIDSGTVTADETINSVVDTYLRTVKRRHLADTQSKVRTRTATSTSSLKQIECIGQGRGTTLTTGAPASLIFTLTALTPSVNLTATIYDSFGTPIISITTKHNAEGDRSNSALTNCFVCDIDELPLRPGTYRINVAIHNGVELTEHIEGATVIEVYEGLMRGRRIDPCSGYGSLALPHTWQRPY
ncbi:Teichoic acids export ATP-binding protein TagH [Symmachiella macrocystis]|uniref:Teichoic acids export ATP-binding protein TagH n=1 Tax=Symmachiella macrocystis TaxID=2527985 RepID=A0A5C6B6K2_9PLAN|nr:ABC transporter ATP-binding protein [Symmachiella macrocystis]TWU06959.1 Teichoic acids export ATP-binding protein TagH [Symmachiella macrocystis]